VAALPAELANCTGFQWDRGNADKNWRRHRVAPTECEEAFFNRPFLIIADDRHSEREVRYWGLGRTNKNRLLFLVFTIRGEFVRVISARDMSRRERRAYEAEQETS
jgi:uncharacterized protein